MFTEVRLGDILELCVGGSQLLTFLKNLHRAGAYSDDEL